MNIGPLTIDEAKLERLCQKWKIVESTAFGSVLRDDFRQGSDVDLLYRFAPDARWSLFDVMEAEEEFAALLGRAVDLMSLKAIEQSHNWIRRRSILSSATQL